MLRRYRLARALEADDVLRPAAQGGNLEVLRWAREHGCPWDETEGIHPGLSGAALAGHLQVMRWAGERGKAVQVETCFNLS
jgi:hypothetical protein